MRRIPCALWVGLASALFFLACSCRTIWFGDSGELIVAADALGVAHPPGYPLYTALGKLALLFPIGEPAFRLNAMSALFAALTCGCVAALIERWTRSSAAAGFAAALLALSPSFASQAVVAEVYTLHTFLIVLLLLLADRLGESDDRKMLVATAVVFGLALAHRPTVIWALPAIALLLRQRRLSRLVTIVGAGVIVALPLYVWLLPRSAAAAPIHWGGIENLSDLWRHAQKDDVDHTVRQVRYSLM